MVRIVDDATNSAEHSSPDRNRKKNGAQAGYTKRQGTPLSDLENLSGTELRRG
jgi:hypothetical protein